jgi:inhibitor of cysteine peptidase
LIVKHSVTRIFVLIAVVSLASAASVGADGGVISLDEADAGGTVNLRGDQELVIDLEGNLSTGYAWDVASVNGAILQQVGQFEFQQYADAVGSAGRQILRFRAAGVGQTDLVLAYRRSWEDAAPLRTYSVNVLTSGPVTASADAYTGAVLSSPPRDVGPIDAAGVPTAYDWCSRGGCTPVKNQGSCGSCWAFATSGVVESLIKTSTGATRDLAEQYLVSCNTHGWGCGGGSRAFDYFVDRYAPAELGAGAVYETDHPYTSGTTGLTGLCSGSPHAKYEKLVEWGYVAGGGYPTVAQIKQAIYDYGPVYVSVCAGPKWSNYHGGVFNTDESSACNGGTNHGVVLVGWDDNQGVWYLRNSWGTSWGESLAGAGGYMRIVYGTSNVGRYPAYAVYRRDVSITQSAPASGLTPGDLITFTLTVENDGSAVAAGLVVTDVIPAEVLTPTFSSTLSIMPTGAISYVWRVEPLLAGESGVITISGRIDPGLPGDFALVNSATVSDPQDTLPDNNVSAVIVGGRKVYLPLMTGN